MFVSTEQPLFRADAPFSHVIVFEWYDGPLKGLARSATSHAIYYFTMLDCDESLNSRIFAMYAVERSLYDDCVCELSSVEVPQYPVWCPRAAPKQLDYSRWSRDERQRLRAVIGSSRYMDRIVGVREIGRDDVVDVTEWNPDEDGDRHPWLAQFFHAESQR